ncbi:MAG: TetR/AcrR family transcriptional regulator [Spongiibacteraceae bacterium]
MGKSPPAEKAAATQKASRPRSKPSAKVTAAPRKPRQYLRADERRQHILESVREVFARCGLQGSRTRDLAQAAGINQATLFEHFSSKEELFAAAVLQPLNDLLEGSRERFQVYAAADSSTDLLTLMQSRMQKHLENISEAYPLLVQALFADQALGKQLYHKKLQPVITARTELTRNIIKPTMDPELVELASFGMMFAIVMDRIMTGKTRDLAETSRQLSDILLFGCSRQQWDEHDRAAVKTSSISSRANSSPANSSPATPSPTKKARRKSA